MNTEYKEIDFYRKNLNPAYTINHSVSDRIFWDSCKGEFYDALCRQYQEAYEKLPALRISDYLRYFTMGSRTAYENPYHMRRSALMWYCYMEAIENKEKYFDKMLDALWAILEETQWCVPAHSRDTNKKSIIPYEEDSCLDLFTSKTAMEVSTVYSIFKEKIDNISPEIGNRILRKIKKEVYHNMIDNDYLWMGYGRIPNNCNPWTISNTVKSIINMGHYNELEYNVLARCAQVFEMYYDNFPDDGGCDEGASYWSHAGGNAIEYLHDIYKLTNGAFALLLENKTKKMGDYFYQIYVSTKYFLGFSDAVVATKEDWGFLYHIGICSANSNLIKLAKRYYEEQNRSISNEVTSITNRYFYRAEAIRELSKLDGTLEFPLEHYYESIKFLIARENGNEPFGMVLAVKANHNGESHNHLDTGNYIVYKNQVPFVVDVGAKLYTAKTFSSERYTIWNTMSEYHNLPIIGGAGQRPGREYASECVWVKNNSLCAKLEKTYDREYISEYVREIELKRETGEVVLRDTLKLKEKKEVIFVFITPAEVEVSESIKLKYQGEAFEIIPSHSFDITVENIDDDDAHIVRSWGTDLKRILMKTVAIDDCFEFVMN